VFSPDGCCLASGSSDKTIRVWDALTGQNVATLQGHSDVVWSVAFSPDGRLIASSSLDGTIRLWDVATRENMATLQGYSKGVWSVSSKGVWNVSFSPDGYRLASGSADGTIRFWFVSFPEALASSKTREEAFEKLYRASLHVLRYRPAGLDFEPLPEPTDRSSATDRPRPFDKDLLEWLLEVGEKLPEKPQ